MIGPGPHNNMMMENGMQQIPPSQQPSSDNLSIYKENNITSNKNIMSASIVFGTSSKTTDAYKPNPIYIREGQTVSWTNNDNNIHTVTQKSYFNQSNNGNDNLVPDRFNSGILNRGQSFSYMFHKEGIYDYYYTVHQWIVDKIVVASATFNSNTTTKDINNSGNRSNINKSLSSLSSLPS